jgi:hypothetical protein
MNLLTVRLGRLIMDKETAENTVVNEGKEDRMCAT